MGVATRTVADAPPIMGCERSCVRGRRRVGRIVDVLRK